jgi:hypothetical protein
MGNESMFLNIPYPLRGKQHGINQFATTKPYALRAMVKHLTAMFMI